MERMTQADFARRHDVSRKTVTMWKRSELVVMDGDLVNVPASDERLRRYRFAEDGRAQRGARKQAQRLGEAPAAAVSGRVQLAAAEILRRLQALDWRQAFDWSDEAQAERARQAARCIGMQAVESDLRDDGHWGAFQLRDPRWVRNGIVLEDAILTGYGFEASPLEVLRFCRAEVTPDADDDDGDSTYTVDLALLPLIAYPHHEHEQPAREDAPA